MARSMPAARERSGSATTERLRALAGAALFAVFLPWPAVASAAEAIPVRVVVVTTFEIGADTGDVPGEFQQWVEKLPLPTVLPFPQGYRHLRFNRRLGVLAMVSGEGPARMASSMTALGYDPRFDLRRAYFVVAGIAGIDPNVGSVGSAAWARYVVNGEAHEIDAREIPPNWTTGYVPLQRTKPYEQPVPPANDTWGTAVYKLNLGLVNWAFELTKTEPLPDSHPMRALRGRYTGATAARKPPFVLEGDTLSSGNFWLGAKLNAWAEAWTRYWTHDKGAFATTAEEDGAMMQSLTFLARTHRVDLARVLVLRTASDYDMPPPGQSAAQLLAAEGTSDGFVAYRPSLDSAYAVGSKIVRELASHWDVYRDKIPSTGH